MVMLTKHLLAPGAALLITLGVCAWLPAQETDQVTVDFLAGAKTMLHSNTAQGRMIGAAVSKTGAAGLATINAAGIPGIDSIVNFNGRFTAPGFDPAGNPNTHWFYNMVGTSPETDKTTMINAPVIPVSLDLRNFDGSPRFVNGQRLYSDATRYVKPVLRSPIFKNARFSSSERPTQISDAVQRAEFGDDAEDNWHTLLKPHVGTPLVMTLIRGTYLFSLNPDGSCCAFVLIDANTFVNELFPPTFPVDASTVIGAAELSGDMKTTYITSLLFPNAFLFVNGNPSDCCILGFHSYDFEPGIPSNGNRERRYVMDYSSWISPGLFGEGFEDVTALSHEMSEIFNDPFVASDGVHNITPWWLSPNGNCQDNLEDGDVIEGLPNSTFPMTLHGFTYHPQNEALLPWFEFKSPSTALHHAYSYPDETVLTALSPLEKVNCAP